MNIRFQNLLISVITTLFEGSASYVIDAVYPDWNLRPVWRNTLSPSSASNM